MSSEIQVQVFIDGKPAERLVQRRRHGHRRKPADRAAERRHRKALRTNLRDPGYVPF